MTSGKVDVGISCSRQTKILLDIKCGKCTRVVRNGVICDYCDKWYHFSKCSEISKDEAPQLTWVCKLCVGKQNTVTYETMQSKINSEEQKEIENVILKLTEEIESLRAVNALLQQQLEILEGANTNSSNFITDNIWPPLPGKTSDTSRGMWSAMAKSRKKSENHKDEVKMNKSKNNSIPVPDEDMLNESTIRTESEVPVNKGIGKRNDVSVNTGVIKFYGDSQGKRVTQKIINQSNSKITSTIKPGAIFADISKEVPHECKGMGLNDLVVFLAGTNDIAKNQAKGFLQDLRKQLQMLLCTNVLIFTIPHRFDLPPWSSVNKEVERVNKEIYRLAKHLKNVYLVDLNHIGRRFYTNHGFHLNNIGKRYVSTEILKVAQKIDADMNRRVIEMHGREQGNGMENLAS